MSQKNKVIQVEDPVDAGSESDADERRATQYLCNTPGFMSAVMRRQVLQERVKTLPENVQNRIRALKNVQLEQLKLESEFYEEVYKLERKYHERYQPLFDKRKQIVTGDLEPSKEEANWKSDDEEEEVTERMKEITLKIKKNLKSLYPDDVKGIPDFWLTIFRSTELLSEMVQEHDEPVLKKLHDIKIVHSDDPMSYIIEFHFEKNEYFSNPILTKQYFLKTTVDEDYPFSFEGPEIYKCVGCNINWEKGMNLTIKIIRKKQKHKEHGAVRTITKQVPTDSFFNFFNPPEVSDDKTKIDEDSQGILGTDFEIGHFLRARIIPKAVLFYTGDVVDDEDDDDDFDEEEGEEDDEEEEDSDEEDVTAPNKGGQQQKTGNKKKPTPNECPSQ